MPKKMATLKKEVIDHVETGKRVRAERERAEMSLRKLAHFMGISPPFLSDLELGRRNWTKDRFDLAMRILNGNL